MGTSEFFTYFPILQLIWVDAIFFPIFWGKGTKKKQWTVVVGLLSVTIETETSSDVHRVATAQGKLGIWKSIIPRRENTGNLLKNIKNITFVQDLKISLLTLLQNIDKCFHITVLCM